MTSRLQQRFTSFVRDEEEMKKTAKIIRTELLLNIRSGVDSKNDLLPQLKNSTGKQRGYAARYNRVHSKYSQWFSNLTFSGQFLRSLKVKGVKGGYFSFFYSGTHKGNKTEEGERGDTVKNAEIFGWLNDKWFNGRTNRLTGVTASAQNRIKKQFIRFLRRKKK
tara:strand:- start:4097 stop:4588 length:492 start_codon:yes stop_codon:yes gene_type:complete